MRVPTSVVVVGASLAGGCVAEGLRRRGYDGRIVLVGDEEHEPYERPPLSKAVLTGAGDIDSLRIRPTGWQDLDVELVLGERVESMDLAGSSVVLGTGSRLAADRIVLCTGGRSRRLGVAGEDLDGVFQLRTVDEAVRLRGQLGAGRRVVVIGAGFIGAEVAASALALGCQVTIVEQATVPLARALGDRWGPFVLEEHQRRGADLHLARRVLRLLGTTRVTGVELDEGQVIEADTVVIGIGMLANDELARTAGLTTSGGIVVDPEGRTSVPQVLAAGDVTVQTQLDGSLVRRESFQNAQEQGDAVAATILGEQPADRDVPWFWSDQFEHNIQMAGVSHEYDQCVIRGDLEARRFVAFHLTRGKVTGLFAVNGGRDVRAGMRLIASGTELAPAVLEDAGVDLRRVREAGRVL